MGESHAAVARHRRLGRDTALAVRAWDRGREEWAQVRGCGPLVLLDAMHRE